MFAALIFFILFSRALSTREFIHSVPAWRQPCSVSERFATCQILETTNEIDCGMNDNHSLADFESLYPSFRMLSTKSALLKSFITNFKKSFVENVFRDELFANDLERFAFRFPGFNVNLRTMTVNVSAPNATEQIMEEFCLMAWEELARLFIHIENSEVQDDQMNKVGWRLANKFLEIRTHNEFGLAWLMCLLKQMIFSLPSNIVRRLTLTSPVPAITTSVRHTRDYMLLHIAEQKLDQISSFSREILPFLQHEAGSTTIMLQTASTLSV